MTRLRIKITAEYNADPKDYQTEDPKEMANIDQKAYNQHNMGIEDFIEGADSIEVTIEPV